jgi:wobble nucleotide-excising tRNase
MIQITKVTKLRDCATFRQFTWPTNLPPFSRYNLIYGWNGTGKTTLSNVFRCLEKRTQPDASDAQIEIGTNTIRFADFLSYSTPSVRVFNRDFIREHVFPDDGTLPPVFVLGDTSIKAQEELDTAKSKLLTVNASLPAARKLAKKANDDFEKFCIDQAKAIKDSLQVSGIDPYRNYNQSHYKKCVARFDQPQQPASSALTDARKAEIARMLTQPPLDSIQLVENWAESAHSHEIDVRAILSESVVAQVLDELKEDVVLSTWIETGLKLHPEEDRSNCKFCAQPLPRQRIAKLEGHFNDAVDNLKSRVTAKIKLLESAKASLARKLPVKAELYPQFQSKIQAEIKAFELKYKAMLKEYDLMIGALRKKAANLFASVPMTENFLALSNSVIDSLNSTIKDHNKETAQLAITKQRACEEWELGAVFQSYKDYKKKNSARVDADNKVSELIREEAVLAAECARLEASLRQHRRPAEELNAELKSYLGHGDLSLEVHETGYRIMRGSTLAIHLSEGERTAIAILYFLKSLQDTSFNLADGVVVLDDPVSSLDERALFSAFSYIQNKTNPAGQVFILTHNFSFFRLVKRWFTSKNRKGGQGNPVVKSTFYMLECKSGSGDRNSMLAPLDKLLADYESDYQYLFSKVFEVANQPPSATLESNYHIPKCVKTTFGIILEFSLSTHQERFPQPSGGNTI